MTKIPLDSVLHHLVVVTCGGNGGMVGVVTAGIVMYLVTCVIDTLLTFIKQHI